MPKIIHKACGKEILLIDIERDECPHCYSKLYEESISYVNRLEGLKEEIGEQAYYTNRFEDVAESIFKHVRGVKTADYGETWKRLGLRGIYVKLFIKEGRLNELIWKKGATDVANKDESIKDTLMDMAAYSIYAMICLEENNIDGDAATREHFTNMIKAINERMGLDGI